MSTTTINTNIPTELVLFTSRDGEVSVSARLDRETVWLTQDQMAQVFEVQRPAVTWHLRNIFKTKELETSSTCSILEHMGQGGTRAYTTNVLQPRRHHRRRVSG